MAVPPPDPPARLHPLLVAGLALCLFGMVVGAKWAVVYRFGSDMPNWDQWDAEALQLLAPWFEGDHFVSHLFNPHNEHRVVLTKLQNLGSTLLSGQWDARLECVANAALHAALAVAFWLLGRRWADARWHAPLFVLIAALFGLPLAWENLLGGFHSQQYWLLALSFAAITTLPFARTGSARWWWGCAAAILALGSMASGFFAAVAVLALFGIQILRKEISPRAAGPVIVLMGILVLVGVLTRVTVGPHEYLKAKTAGGFFLYLVRSFAWPLRGYDWAAAILWLPWLQVVGQLVTTKSEPSSGPAGMEPDDGEARARLILSGLGGWVLLQLLATAYARGSGADYPAPRYMDTLVFGAAVNGVALAFLLSVRRTTNHLNSLPQLAGTGRPLLPSAIAVLWLGTLAAGLQQTVKRNLNDEMPGTKGYYVNAEAHLRGYLATDDPAQFAFPDIPYPSADGLVERLAHPSLRALMPVTVRAPLAVRASAESASAFHENQPPQRAGAAVSHHGLSPSIPPLKEHPTWGSFGPNGAATTGVWTSAPLTSQLGGWLKFETAGQLGEPGISLELHDAETGVRLATILADQIPGDTWLAAYVRAPRRPFVVVAQDRDPSRWLAFSGPVEMGNLSHWAWRATQNGLVVTYYSTAGALVLGLAAWGRHRDGARVARPS